MNVKDLILEAGGISPNVYGYKVEVARIDPKKLDDENFAEIIGIEINNDFAIDNDQEQHRSDSTNFFFKNNVLTLQPYDHVSVRQNPYFRMQQKVFISGAVYYPGTYTIKGPDEKISDILKRAGGIRPNAYPVASTFTRFDQMVQIDLKEIIKKPYSKADVNVQNGDSIFVAVKPTIAQVLGEVSSPGFYKFIPNKRVNDYISMAGGFSQDAEKRDIWIRYPNGKSKQYGRWLSNPKVLDGSVITVGLKKEKESFDSTEFAKEMASIMTDFAQLALIIVTLGSI